MLPVLEDLTLFYFLLHALGLIAAIDAVYWSRTSQGAIGWGISLLSIPMIALPLYLFLGRNRFRGHKKSVRRKIDLHRRHVQAERTKATPTHKQPESATEKIFEILTESQFVDGNNATILIDGAKTFEALFKSIENATEYILLQYYTVRDDSVGRKLKDLLLKKSSEGVKIYFMYDAWGSSFLSSSYISDLNQNGIRMRPFEIRQKLTNFFQLNFRNHRKITVVDGKIGFLGGINIGDEYTVSSGANYWRDTQIQIIGPAVLSLQASFVADWFWATSEAIDVNWAGTECFENGKRVLPVLTGPADSKENCTFFFLEAILSAKKRIWISTPYFVPTDELLRALQLAAFRGVDVRLLLPKKADHYLTWAASFAYMPEVSKYGVKIYRYSKGFLHQKAFIIDDLYSAIGSANLDYRSIRLNFEVTVLVKDEEFTRDLVDIFNNDLKSSELYNPDKKFRLGFLRHGASKFARLFSPLL